MPIEVSAITNTFITDTSDIYIMCETIDRHFEAYHIDLDSPDPYVNGPLMRYHFDKVESLPVTSFHARASSQKEKINLNKVLLFFMMHGTNLYCFSKGKLKCVSQNAFNMAYFSDDQLFFMSKEIIKVKNKEVLHAKIYMLECLFGSYKCS
jgi:hypothetical protein